MEQILVYFFEDVREETEGQNIDEANIDFLFSSDKECGVRKSDSSSEGYPFIHAAHGCWGS
jgi:hypothetical protein